MKISEEVTTDALYFRTFHSYCLHKPDLRDNYEMLLDHYKNNPNSFRCLTKNDLLRIKQIQEDIKNNRYTFLCGSIDYPEDLQETVRKEKLDKKHSEICFQLVKRAKEILEPHFGTLNFIAMEFPTIYGPIDIVIQNGDTVYIIEVKTSNATHAIIGQVSKYYTALCLKIVLRHYDEVKIVTMCPGYDRASLAGLKRIGADPFILNSNPLEIKRLNT